MDRPLYNDQLGVNKIGKKITKSPLHQPKPKKIIPVALLQINRPHVCQPVMARPIAQPYMQPLPHGSQTMMGYGDHFGSNTAASPVSVYMPCLQSSLGDSGPNGNQMQQSHESQPQPQVRGQAQPHPPPQSHNHHSPQFNSYARDKPILPTPRFNGPPHSNSLPSPRFNGRGILPSPTSQYLLQSPTAYRNSLPHRSPYPLLSPGVQHPLPLTARSSTSSSMSQPGILGPGTIPQPPASPGLIPSSPFGVFPRPGRLGLRVGFG